MALKRKWIVAVTVAGVVGYFALATYFERTYVDPRPAGRVAIRLTRPYWHEGGFAYRASSLLLEDARRLAEIPADDPANTRDLTSPIQIYENGTNIGLAHSSFADIARIGGGRFGHWRDRHIIFSSSDNSDPRTNGRSYWAVVR